MSIGVIAAHDVIGGGSGVAFVARSSAFTTSSYTLTAHAGTQVGDKQILAIATFQSITPSTPTGWTLLSRTTTTYSSLTIFTRTIDSGNISSSVTGSVGADSRAEMRTYRNATSFTVAGNGTGLVAPARTATGLLVRYTANAKVNSGFAASATLTPAAALANSSGAVTWNWYEGLVVGDDPSSPGSAPSRTATDTYASGAPQWVDVQVT